MNLDNEFVILLSVIGLLKNDIAALEEYKKIANDKKAIALLNSLIRERQDELEEYEGRKQLVLNLLKSINDPELRL